MSPEECDLRARWMETSERLDAALNAWSEQLDINSTSDPALIAQIQRLRVEHEAAFEAYRGGPGEKGIVRVNELDDLWARFQLESERARGLLEARNTAANVIAALVSQAPVGRAVRVDGSLVQQYRDADAAYTAAAEAMFAAHDAWADPRLRGLA